MSAIENDPDRYERMAQRTTQAAIDRGEVVDRENWPVPPELRGYSARDAFLWYITDGWRRIFGENEPIETLDDNDFGFHVLRKGSWQLTLVDTGQFPDNVFVAEREST